MGQLSGRVAIVTGATGAVGSATTQLFAREGATVIAVARDAERLEALVRSCESALVHACPADVSTTAGNRAAVAAALEHGERLDVFFANAGICGPIAPLTTISEDQFDAVMDLNVRGVWLGLKHAMPVMQAHGGGSIILAASVSSLIGVPMMAAYAASKHALIGLGKSAAIEGGPAKVRVNMIAPGGIDGDMVDEICRGYSPEAPEAVRAAFIGQVPLARFSTGHEVARLALFLASEASSSCTGGVYPIDGGYAAG